MKTRWNSCLFMLERLAEQKTAVELYVFKYKPNFPILDNDEWQVLSEICDLLKPLEQASRKVKFYFFNKKYIFQ